MLHRPEHGKRYSSTTSSQEPVHNSIDVPLSFTEDFILADINNLTRAYNIHILDHYRKPSLIDELGELLENYVEWEEDGITIEKASVEHAIKFAENSILPNKLQTPHIEVHPDGEVAFTWRKLNRGIINIAFNKEGIATWAAYFNNKQRSTIKGRFYVEGSIPEIEKTIIQSIIS